MPPRAHNRIPASLRVRYRTTSSFLIAYSVNISRGGMFLETTSDAAVGDRISLKLEIEDRKPIEIPGRVAWRREIPDDTGPMGIGVEFQQQSADLGLVIDELVAEFTRSHGTVKVLVVAPDVDASDACARVVKSTIASAEILTATNATTAVRMLGNQIELAVIDATRDAMTAIAVVERISRQRDKPGLPTVVLSNDPALAQRARASGATEVVSGGDSAQLGPALIRALGRPNVG